jgi:Domain of Kin17 curved DNA-binding protein.
MIQDKHHIHMNATKWTTLSDFVQYLGKTGKCVVEETERGWYVTYIERDPTILAQQENYQRRVDAERRQEERLAKQMELQRIEAAKLMDRAGIGLKVEASKLLGENDGGGGDAAEKSL